MSGMPRRSSSSRRRMTVLVDQERYHGVCCGCGSGWLAGAGAGVVEGAFVGSGWGGVFVVFVGWWSELAVELEIVM